MTRSHSSRRPADSPADRRKQILRAAVEAFAERGFQRTRVSDIAKRAGVAYGLIYHYFENKDHVLDSVFTENWAIFVKVLGDIEQDTEAPADARLAQVAELLIDALRIEPALIQVIIQEISRSDRFVQPTKFDAFQAAFTLVQRIIEQGQDLLAQGAALVRSWSESGGADGTGHSSTPLGQLFGSRFDPERMRRAAAAEARK